MPVSFFIAAPRKGYAGRYHPEHHEKVTGKNRPAHKAYSSIVDTYAEPSFRNLARIIQDDLGLPTVKVEAGGTASLVGPAISSRQNIGPVQIPLSIWP